MSKRFFLCLITIACALRAAEPASDVASLAAAYASPTLGPAGKLAKALRISNMTFDLNGLAAPVLAGGTTVGIFFNGAGHYRYHSTDPVESPLVLFEARKLGRSAQKSADGTVTVEGDFERLYLRGGAIDLPQIEGEVSPALQQVFTQHRERFANARWQAPSHLLIEQRLDDPASPVAIAEMGGSDDNAYLLDGVEENEERLLAMITDATLNQLAELKGALYPITIAQQPVGRSRAAFLQPPVILGNVDYTLVAGDKDLATLRVTETIVPRRAAKSVLRLDELNIIEINDLGWGQAPPGTMFITKEAFNPLLTEANRFYSFGINQRFAHEIAHQYWGHVVKVGSLEEAWIAEAFAEYCSAMVVKQIEGQRGYDAMVQRWRNDAKLAGTVAPIPLAYRIVVPKDPLDAETKRVGLTYSKGAYLLTALRQEVGDKNFFLLLRNLQGLFEWRFVTTKDVAALMQRIDGKDHQAFFDRYFWGTEMPSL
jgi:hypothetical protein